MASITLPGTVLSAGALGLIALEPHLGHFSPPDSRYDLKVIIVTSFFHHRRDPVNLDRSRRLPVDPSPQDTD